MISSSQLGLDICSELDQNAYTSWHNPQKILRVINSACNYVLAYWKWPWSLKVWDITLPVAGKSFTFDHNIFYPYWAYLDEKKLDPTVVPLMWFLDDNTWKYYVNGNIVTTTEAGKNLKLLYHNWHNKITSLGNNDIDIPEEFYQALIHVALRFVYPGGLDIWSSLANQNYNMAKDLLTAYAKAYWPLIQPKQAEMARIYNP